MSRSVVEGLLLLYAAVGGAVAWTLQLWLGWLIGDLGCAAQPGEFVLLGLGTSALWLLVGLVTGAVAAGATLVAYRLVRRPPAADDPAGQGVRRFIAAGGLALNLLLVGTIVLGATSPLFVPPCV